jgi:hypothetical protein
MHNPASSSAQKKYKKVDVIDELINDARRLVEFRDLYVELPSYNQPIQPNFNIFQFNDEALRNISPLNITNSRRPFGFRIYTCERCVERPIYAVFYPDTGQAIHKCRPERLAAIVGMFDKHKHVLESKDYSIQWLKQIITGSPANRYNYLVALPLSNPPEEFLPLSNAAFPMTCIELDRDRKDQDNNDIIYNHWTSRAITQGLTQLTNREITEFPW